MRLRSWSLQEGDVLRPGGGGCARTTTATSLQVWQTLLPSERLREGVLLFPGIFLPRGLVEGADLQTEHREGGKSHPFPKHGET